MTGARESVMRMIDLLGSEHGMSAVDAYLLCSVCGDLRISEIVDHAELGRVLLLPEDRIRVTCVFRRFPGSVHPQPQYRCTDAGGLEACSATIWSFDLENRRNAVHRRRKSGSGNR
jgi:hypothetical protein